MASGKTIFLRDAPKLEFTEFDGKYEEFPFFKAQVTEAIRSQHSEVQVLRHLKERLKGQAFQAVHGTLLTGASLEDVWAILEERFGNPQIIVSRTVKNLLNFPQIREGDIERLERFSTEVSNAIAILRSIGLAEELDSLQVIQKLTAKLPKDSRNEWGFYGRSKVGGGRVTCELFCAFMRTHVKDRRFCADTDMSEDGPKSRLTEKRPATRPKHATYATTEKIRCFFCDDHHFIQRCETFKRMTVRERQKWASENRVCSHCLSKTHETSSCHRKRPCGLNGCQERRRCRAFLDEGSSLTLMDRSLAEDLGLSGPEKQMDIKTVSGIDTMDTMAVEVEVENIQTGQIFRLRDVTSIRGLNMTSPAVSGRQLKSLFREVRELNLPDLNEAPKLLIGLDNAELIAAREVRKTGKTGLCCSTPCWGGR